MLVTEYQMESYGVCGLALPAVEATANEIFMTGCGYLVEVFANQSSNSSLALVFQNNTFIFTPIVFSSSIYNPYAMA